MKRFRCGRLARDPLLAKAAGFAVRRGSILGVALAVIFALTAVSIPGARARGDAGADGHFERRDSFHFTLYQDVDIDEYGGFHGSRRLRLTSPQPFLRTPRAIVVA